MEDIVHVDSRFLQSHLVFPLIKLNIGTINEQKPHNPQIFG